MQQIEQTLVAIQKDQSNLIEAIKCVKVESDKDIEKYSEILVQIKARIKRIEEKRTEYVKPMNDQVKKINADFKQVSEPYINIERSIKTAIAEYLDEKRRIEAEWVKKEEEERQARAKEYAKETGVPKQEILAVMDKPEVIGNPTTIKTENSKIVNKLVKKFEIVDANLVPVEYKIVDERLIRQAINQGKSEIPGVRIWEETQVSSFRRF